MRVFSLLVLISVFIAFPYQKGQAQDDTERSLMVSIVPQYLAVQALRVDIDKKMNDEGSWLSFSPKIYVGYINKNGSAAIINDVDYWPAGSEYDQMIGAGLDIYHKIFLGKEKLPLGFYYAYGGGLRFLHMSFISKSIYTDSSVFPPVFRFNKFEGSQNILSGNVGMLLGYQEQIKDYFLTDFYMGVGARYSDDSKGDFANTRRYDRRMWDYAWTGTQFIIGMRFGVLLK